MMDRRGYMEAYRELWLSGRRHDRRTVEKMAAGFGIGDKVLVKELTELATLEEYGKTAREPRFSMRERFREICRLYEAQVNLSHRTSRTMMMGQFGTPAPLAFLAGWYCGIEKAARGSCFEPSAGVGMLTLLSSPESFHVNEIDPLRRSLLEELGFAGVTDFDGSTAFPEPMEGRFRAVLTNPPFGRYRGGFMAGDFKLSMLDHVMARHALETMRDDGKAALIIGNHHEWDQKGRIVPGPNRRFLAWLYHHYNVEDLVSLHKAFFKKMGTVYWTRLILINGRKKPPGGYPPLRSVADRQVKTFPELFDRVERLIPQSSKEMKQEFDNEARELLAEYGDFLGEDFLDGPYRPRARGCISLDTMVPDNMDAEIHRALEKIEEEIGEPLAEFVRNRLGYATAEDLCEALSAEQVDAVALAIYNIEFKGQGMIIADQTGIGKGRVAASMIRYGVAMGVKPIFITEKANLFSDLYRDLAAIGSGHLRPLIVNSRSASSHVKDQEGGIVWKAPVKDEQEEIFATSTIPAPYRFAMATYSQFNNDKSEGGRLKRAFLAEASKGGILILDESHNASGASKTGMFFAGILKAAAGAVFLSATFAKRPDNMPLYASKTALSGANLSLERLSRAVESGGVALQEVVSAQLVAEGQLIRRERSYEGVEVNYITLDKSAAAFGLEDMERRHRAISDSLTEIMRGIIGFQEKEIAEIVEKLDRAVAAKMQSVDHREGTKKMGVDNTPYFSKVFQIVNQMLMSIKAESAAKLAIKRLREGKKPVIAFSSTLESFYDDLETVTGEGASIGDEVKADFTYILQKGLDGVFRTTRMDVHGNSRNGRINLHELTAEGRQDYQRLSKLISSTSSGISISPIDHIIQLIEAEGFSVAEVTGRSRRLALDLEGMQAGGAIKGRLLSRKKIPTVDAFRKFNNNEVDVLLINRSGSTGASAHAIATAMVPPSQVKQRVMIVLQPELNINTEIQKRGRINRTGQLHKPVYDYLVSAIPAEKRMLMMLQKKLKSLDANTSSNQRQSEALLHSDDFLNKYGSKVVRQLLKEQKDLDESLGKPSESKSHKSGGQFAHFVSGRIAALPTDEQERFYADVIQAYRDLVEFKKMEGSYDLELETLDLRAKTLKQNVVVVGRHPDSILGSDTIMEYCEVRNLRKPFTQSELSAKISSALGGKTPQEVQNGLLVEFREYMAERKTRKMKEIQDRFQRKMDGIPAMKIIREIETEAERTKTMGDVAVEYRKAMEEEINGMEGDFANKAGRLGGLIRHFHIGRGLVMPTREGDESDPVVCLGFSIDRKRKNPWAPSAIRLSFALGNSKKYVAGNLTGEFLGFVNSLRGASADLDPERSANMAKRWGELTGKLRTDWTYRHILTGNLLQASGRFKGKLVSYSTRDGQTQKGLLMKEKFEPANDLDGMVSIPLAQSRPILHAMKVGEASRVENLMIERISQDALRLYTGASQTKGARYYKNQDLLDLVHGGVFVKSGERMNARMEFSNLDKLIDLLDEKFSPSLKVPSGVFRAYEKELKKLARIRKGPQLVPKVTGNTEILELEAEALSLLYELLEYAA